MLNVRKPAVAGYFYPNDSKELSNMIHKFLAKANSDLPIPKAIIAPHAGYVYSGPIAASAYAVLSKVKQRIKQIILLGPAHRYPLKGIAIPQVDFFATPLGQIPIDKTALSIIAKLPQVKSIEAAFNQEHSLEVQLPFLQTILSQFSLVPLLVGQTSPEQVAEVLKLLWGDESTLIIVSSDLSHYHEYQQACQIDQVTAQDIAGLCLDKIGYEQACGRNPMLGLLHVAKEFNMRINVLDLRNSGDTAGSKDSVVGYGAFHLNMENE